MRSNVTLHETGKDEKEIKDKVIKSMSRYLGISELSKVESMIYTEINARQSETDPLLFEATVFVRVRV